MIFFEYIYPYTYIFIYSGSVGLNVSWNIIIYWLLIISAMGLNFVLRFALTL